MTLSSSTSSTLRHLRTRQGLDTISEDRPSTKKHEAACDTLAVALDLVRWNGVDALASYVVELDDTQIPELVAAAKVVIREERAGRATDLLLVLRGLINHPSPFARKAHRDARHILRALRAEAAARVAAYKVSIHHLAKAAR